MEQRSVAVQNVIATRIEGLETRQFPSALSLVQGALSGVSDFLGVVDGAVMGIHSGVTDVPLLGDKVDESLQSLHEDIAGVRAQIDGIAAQITNEALANDVQLKLFEALGPAGINILGSSSFGADANLVQQDDIFVLIADGDVLPSIEVNFNLHRDLLDKTLAQGQFTIGLDGLPFKVDLMGVGGVKVNVGFDYQNFHLKFDETNGFVFDDSVLNELTLYASAGLTDGAELNATVGFVKAILTDGVEVDGQIEKTGLTFIEPIDVKFDGGLPLHFQTPYLSAALNLHLDAGFSDAHDGLNREFPGFATDFVLKRNFGSAPVATDGEEAPEPHFVSPNAVGSPNGMNAIQNLDETENLNPADVLNTVTATFEHVQFKLGEFITRVLRPIIKTMQDIDSPIKPLLDLLREDLPILSQDPILGDLLNNDGKDGVSFIDLASVVAKINVLPPQYDSLLEMILFFDGLRNFIDSIDTQSESGQNLMNMVLDLGDHELINKAIGGNLMSLDPAMTDAPATVKSLSSDDLNFDGAGNYSFTTLKNAVHQKLTDFGLSTDIVDGIDTLLAPTGNGVNYTFPLFENPTDSIMQMLIGKDANLFLLNGQYIVPPNEVHIPIPMALPFGLQAELFGSMELNCVFKVGYDTFGLRSLFAAGVNDAGVALETLLDGNWVSSDTHMTVNSTFGLRVGVDYPVFEAKIEGGVFANLDLRVPTPPTDPDTGLPKDADNDTTKVRLFSELGECLMDVNGELSASLAVSATVGVGPLSVTKHFDIAKITLIELRDCLPNPLHTVEPHLANKDANGVLTLLTGDVLGSTRNIEPLDFNDVFTVIEIAGPNGPITVVQAYGRSQSFTGITKIVADGGLGNDHFVIDKSVHVNAVLNGGFSDDDLDYRGTGSATLKGGAGNDVLRGGNGAKNVLLGETGNDTISGGGTDGTTMNIFGISAADGVTDDANDDLMQGGKGHNLMHGGSGNDRLYAGPLNDSLFGDVGNDELQAGIGQSTLTGSFGNDTFVIASDSGSTRIFGDGDHDTVGIEGTDAVDTFLVNSVNNLLTVSQTTAGVVGTRTITMTSVEDLLLDGKRSADNITVNYLLNTRLEHLGLNLQDLTNLDGAADHIVVNGRTVADTVTVSSEQVDIKQQVDHLGPQGGITTVTGLPTYKIDIANVQDDVQIRMLGGNDIINVKGVSGPTIIDAGNGDDTFNVSTKFINDYLGVADLQTGSGKTQLNFTTDAIATPDQITLTEGQINAHWINPQSGEPTAQLINYTQTNGGNFTNGINLTTNGINDNLFIRSTLAGVTTTVNTAGGDDTIVVASVATGNLGKVDGIHGPLKIDAGSGSNNALKILDFAGSSNQNVTITSTQVLGIAGANGASTIDYKSIGGQLLLEINGSDNANVVETFLVKSPNASLLLGGNRGNEVVTVESLTKPAAFFGGDGNDQLKVGAANKLNSIQAPLGFFSGDGFDSLTLNDQSQAVAGQYTIGGNSVGRAGTGTVSFNNDLELLTLNTSTSGDNIQVTQQPTTPTVNVNSGNGNDQLTGPNSTSTWQITSQNTGTLNNNLHFTNTESLRGGTGNDRFLFGSTALVTGTIKDLGGNDTLDYSARTQSISVDLQFQTATATNGAQGIENVVGGSGNDYIAGNASANNIDGGNGDDILLGREGNDSLNGGNGRDILIGGLNADTLDGGPDTGEDILIGGRTIHDNNLGNLNLIRAEWSRIDLDYQHRIDNLRAGVGPAHSVKLNAAANLDDAIADVFSGKDGFDWYWALTSGVPASIDQLTDLVTGEQIN